MLLSISSVICEQLCQHSIGIILLCYEIKLLCFEIKAKMFLIPPPFWSKNLPSPLLLKYFSLSPLNFTCPTPSAIHYERNLSAHVVAQLINSYDSVRGYFCYSEDVYSNNIRLILNVHSHMEMYIIYQSLELYMNVITFCLGKPILLLKYLVKVLKKR